MGMASASASSAAAINATGSGNLYVNQPNYIGWLIGGTVIVLLAIFFIRRKR